MATAKKTTNPKSTPKTAKQEKTIENTGGRSTRVDSAIGLLKSKFKKAVTTADRYGQAVTKECIETPSFQMNLVMGGGLKVGRIHIFSGWNTTFKTGFMLLLCANAQKQGKVCAWVDTENRFDTQLALNAGVDVENLLILSEQDGDTLMEYVRALGTLPEDKKGRKTGAGKKPESDRDDDADDGDGANLDDKSSSEEVTNMDPSQGPDEDQIVGPYVDVIFIDSLSKLMPKSLLGKKFSDETMGVKARKMGEYINTMTAIMTPKDPEKPSHLTVIAANTRYHEIGPFTSAKGKSGGGENLAYQMSSEVYFKRRYFIGRSFGDSETVKNKYYYKVKGNEEASIGDSDVYGMSISFELDKTHAGLKERGRFNVFIRGVPTMGIKPGNIDRVLEVIEVAINLGVIEKGKGSYYIYDGLKFNGMRKLVEGMREMKKEEKHRWMKLEERVKEAYSMYQTGSDEEEDE